MRLKPLAIYWLVLWALVQAVQPQETLLRCPGSELATINLVSDGETINIGKDDCRIHQTTEAGGPAQVGSLRIAGEGSWDLGWDVAVASIGSGSTIQLTGLKMLRTLLYPASGVSMFVPAVFLVAEPGASLHMSHCSISVPCDTLESYRSFLAEAWPSKVEVLGDHAVRILDLETAAAQVQVHVVNTTFRCAAGGAVALGAAHAAAAVSARVTSPAQFRAVVQAVAALGVPAKLHIPSDTAISLSDANWPAEGVTIRRKSLEVFGESKLSSVLDMGTIPKFLKLADGASLHLQQLALTNLCSKTYVLNHKYALSVVATSPMWALELNRGVVSLHVEDVLMVVPQEEISFYIYWAAVDYLGFPEVAKYNQLVRAAMPDARSTPESPAPWMVHFEHYHGIISRRHNVTFVVPSKLPASFPGKPEAGPRLCEGGTPVPEDVRSNTTAAPLFVVRPGTDVAATFYEVASLVGRFYHFDGPTQQLYLPPVVVLYTDLALHKVASIKPSFTRDVAVVGAFPEALSARNSRSGGGPGRRLAPPELQSLVGASSQHVSMDLEGLTGAVQLRGSLEARLFLQRLVLENLAVSSEQELGVGRATQATALPLWAFDYPRDPGGIAHVLLDTVTIRLPLEDYAAVYALALVEGSKAQAAALLALAKLTPAGGEAGSSEQPQQVQGAGSRGGARASAALKEHYAALFERVGEFKVSHFDESEAASYVVLSHYSGWGVVGMHLRFEPNQAVSAAPLQAAATAEAASRRQAQAATSKLGVLGAWLFTQLLGLPPEESQNAELLPPPLLPLLATPWAYVVGLLVAAAGALYIYMHGMQDAEQHARDALLLEAQQLLGIGGAGPRPAGSPGLGTAGPSGNGGPSTNAASARRGPSRGSSGSRVASAVHASIGATGLSPSSSQLLSSKDSGRGPLQALVSQGALAGNLLMSQHHARPLDHPLHPQLGDSADGLADSAEHQGIIGGISAASGRNAVSGLQAVHHRLLAGGSSSSGGALNSNANSGAFARGGGENSRDMMAGREGSNSNNGLGVNSLLAQSSGDGATGRGSTGHMPIRRGMSQEPSVLLEMLQRNSVAGGSDVSPAGLGAARNSIGDPGVSAHPAVRAAEIAMEAVRTLGDAIARGQDLNGALYREGSGIANQGPTQSGGGDAITNASLLLQAHASLVGSLGIGGPSAAQSNYSRTASGGERPGSSGPSKNISGRLSTSHKQQGSAGHLPDAQAALQQQQAALQQQQAALAAGEATGTGMQPSHARVGSSSLAPTRTVSGEPSSGSRAAAGPGGAIVRPGTGSGTGSQGVASAGPQGASGSGGLWQAGAQAQVQVSEEPVAGEASGGAAAAAGAGPASPQGPPAGAFDATVAGTSEGDLQQRPSQAHPPALWDPHKEVQQITGELLGGGDDKLTLMELIGQGASGQVYRGKWRNLEVAVKSVVFRQAASGESDAPRQRAIMEAAVCKAIVHPNVVCTYSYDITPVVAQPVMLSPNLQVEQAPDMPVDWKLYLVQELCQATLRAALVECVLHDRDTGEPHMDSILSVLIDIVAGMEYIHSKNIIHGDLKPENVLLRADPGAPLGMVAKITDFGLCSAILPHQTHVSNFSSGTPYYVAPEVVSDGKLTKTSDVYSFGVLMWVMYRCLPPWVRKGAGYARNKLLGKYPETCPPAYSALSIRCLSKHPKARPSFSQIKLELLAMQQAVAAACWPEDPLQGQDMGMTATASAVAVAMQQQAMAMQAQPQQQPALGGVPMPQQVPPQQMGVPAAHQHGVPVQQPVQAQVMMPVAMQAHPQHGMPELPPVAMQAAGPGGGFAAGAPGLPPAVQGLAPGAVVAMSAGTPVPPGLIPAGVLLQQLPVQAEQQAAAEAAAADLEAEAGGHGFVGAGLAARGPGHSLTSLGSTSRILQLTSWLEGRSAELTSGNYRKRDQPPPDSDWRHVQPQ